MNFAIRNIGIAMEQNNCGVNIFYKTLLVIAALLFVYFIFAIKELLILFFIAFVIASAIDIILEKLSTKMSRKKAHALVGISGFFILLVFFLPFLNLLIKQLMIFIDKLPEITNSIETFFINISQGDSPNFVSNILQRIGLAKKINTANFPEIMSAASGFGQAALNGLIGLTKGFGVLVMFIFTTSIIVTFMLKDKVDLAKKFFNIFPKETREKTEMICSKISKRVGGYVFSVAITVLIMATIISIALEIIGIEFSTILGVIAGVLEIVPAVGPLIAGILIVVVALAQKPILALWALIAYIIAELIVDNLVRPFLLGKFLNLHPLTLLFSITAGTLVFGAIGAVIAPMVAAVVTLLIDEFCIKEG